jgi:hypothetical protein
LQNFSPLTTITFKQLWATRNLITEWGIITRQGKFELIITKFQDYTSFFDMSIRNFDYRIKKGFERGTGVTRDHRGGDLSGDGVGATDRRWAGSWLGSGMKALLLEV